MEELDILYTINDKYIDIMLGSILSLLYNGNLTKVRLHIITSNFKLEDYKKIETVLSKFNLEIYFYDLEEYDIEKYNIPNWRGTQIANARLFFKEILDKNLSQINNLLYIDSDTVVVSSLNELDAYKNYVVSAVKDGCYKSYLQKMNVCSYFNSGVILFNVEKWICGDYQDKIFRTIENPPKEIIYPDQDIFNVSLEGNINELPLNYNMGTNAFLFDNLGLKLYFDNESNISYEEVVEAKKDPKILHSIGVSSIKPWTNNNIHPLMIYL